jgi:hypothetical protein
MAVATLISATKMQEFHLLKILKVTIPKLENGTITQAVLFTAKPTQILQHIRSTGLQIRM